MSLATKYRPKEFEEVCSQETVIKILQKQLELKKYSNCMLFSGISGGGKTTLARILANKINNGQGEPIEIDAASNNGVDNIRNIIADAKERSLSSEYKIFIIDEAHMITTQGWNAFLKCLEEPPKYSIFILCTTDPQKIPSTIQNRLMRFNLTPIPSEDIENRLNYICRQENFINYDESTKYISKLVDGSMRKAISYIEKIASYSNNLNIENTLKVLGNSSYNYMFDLTNAIIDRRDNDILKNIENMYSEGIDLKIFINQYIDFLLDLCKYCILKNIESTKIPSLYEQRLNYTVNVENNIYYFKGLLNKILEIKENLKYDSSVKSIIIIKLIELTRG